MTGKKSGNARPRDSGGHFQPLNGANGHAQPAAAPRMNGGPAAFGFGQPPRPPSSPAALPPAPAAPAPPAAAPAAPTPPTPPAAAAPPPAPPPEPPRPPPMSADADTSNRYRERVAARDERTFGAVSRPFPQSEMNLPQVWLAQLRTRRIPPQAMTISMRSVRPDPPYDFWIDGASVCGEHPDRELFAYIESLRRRPDEHETMIGRIMALDGSSGEPMDLGWGQLYLAPRAPQAQAGWSAPQPSAWRPPGAPPGTPPAWPGPPYGAPPAPPYGPPPWAGGPPPYGYPPPYSYGYGAQPWGGPWGAPHAPAAPPAPTPPPPTNDPVLLTMWRESNSATLDAQAKHLALMEKIALERQQPGAAAAAGGGQAQFAQQFDQTLSFMEKMAGVFDKFRGPQEAPGNPVHVTTLPGGDTLVATKDGIDTNMTGLFMAKDMVSQGTKRIADAIAKRQVNASVASGGTASVVQASAGRPPRPT